MAKGRDNVAESVGDVLQIISSRRRNGLLSVEHYEAGRFEEGEIYFQKGRPVHARFGALSAQDSMTKLLGWRHVYYAFFADVPVPNTSPENSPGTPPPTHAGADPFTQPPLRNTTGSYPPTPGWQTQEPPSFPFSRPEQSLPVTSPQPLLPQTPSFSRTSPERTTGYAQSATRDASSNPGFEKLVPHRLNYEQDVLSLPLTRIQRSIFLLIDGNRTVADLSRCTRKNVQEVARLLGELEQLGFVLL